MIPTHDKLSLAVYLYRSTSLFLNEDGNWEGILPEDINYLEVIEALDHQDMQGMILDEESRKFDFAAPPSFFFVSIEDFLRSPNRRVSVPAKFYIADLDYFYPNDDQCPEIITNYIMAVQFFEVVSNSFADDTRPLGSDKTLIFLNNRKLEITSEFHEKDLKGLISLDNFIQDFAISTVHTKQKKTIFKSVLFSMFEGASEVRFSDLLAIIDGLIEQVNASYQLYVSEFSFQKVKAEVEREKLEFTTRLNKVFSDIQNQLLAIPAAMILVGGQMKQVNTLSLSNILIWLGSLVFSILMLLLIRNQRNTLAAIKSEIDHQWELIGGNHQAVSGLFEKSYTAIATRHTHQQTLLNIVSSLVILGLVLSTILLAWYSGVKLDSWLSMACSCVESIIDALRLY